MKQTIEDVSLEGKKALVRCDFNVPMLEGKITDDSRIEAALPTIKYLIENKAKVILMSHFGRPKGEANPKYTLEPVKIRLEELLGQEVVFESVSEVVNDSTRKLASELKDGQVMLLENVRFRKEETDNDPKFAKELAELGEIFVQNAFGTAHRAHASTAGVADYLPAYSGFLIQKEIEALGKLLDAPEKPFVAIMGGAKVKDKIQVIENLIDMLIM